MKWDDAPYWAKPFLNVISKYPGVRNVEWLPIEENDAIYESYVVFECDNRPTLGWLAKILSESPCDVHKVPGGPEEYSAHYEPLDIILEAKEGRRRMGVYYSILLYEDQEQCELSIPGVVKALENHLAQGIF